ncbi:hypothetical protein JCM19239_4496 [Vibrio variabilis]|uniref:Uncharacterized protein n=1 Tax=Vibrio variabilis TaxID=990271 RepID=A0ABQ0JQT4_9VIBR|nr:hypothetical protein JCM19239_4496 [Vibrio variabilis]
MGATIGVIGVPDSDISLSYGFEPNPGTIPNLPPFTGGSNGKSDSDRNTGGFGPNDGADPNDDSWSHNDSYNDSWSHDADHERND